MSKLLFSAAIFLGMSGAAQAADYCFDKYEARLSAVDASLGASLKELSDLQARLIELEGEMDTVSRAMVELIKNNPDMSDDIRRQLGELTSQYDVLDREEAAGKSRSFELQDTITAYRTVIPADLSGELRGCVEATKPATQLVNTVIQVLAILTTGGASLALPEKSLYVDMSAVLNGYPFGGDKSLINKGRDDLLDALGLGGSNDLGKTIKDPGRVVRCWFGC